MRELDCKAIEELGIPSIVLMENAGQSVSKAAMDMLAGASGKRIADLNKKHVPILSIDVPSGLDADTGEVLGEAVKAKETVTMQFPKKGFYKNKGPEHVGELVVVDIGII